MKKKIERLKGDNDASVFSLVYVIFIKQQTAYANTVLSKRTHTTSVVFKLAENMMRMNHHMMHITVSN